MAQTTTNLVAGRGSAPVAEGADNEINRLEGQSK
jgi:hypothetical protein